MIIFENVSKSYFYKNEEKVIADNISMVFPTKSSVALLGRNGAGKSSLLKMISGVMNPDSGSITSIGKVSWPVGFAGSFHGNLTGSQNIKFIARIYGVDTSELTEFVKKFSELGNYFYHPFSSYSSGMRARLAFGVSMGIPFDIYLVDEVTSVGDASFRKKSGELFSERMKVSGSVVVSHSLPMIRSMCTSGAVLENGHLYYYEDLEEAIKHHNDDMGVK